MLTASPLNEVNLPAKWLILVSARVPIKRALVSITHHSL